MTDKQEPKTVKVGDRALAETLKGRTITGAQFLRLGSEYLQLQFADGKNFLLAAEVETVEREGKRPLYRAKLTGELILNG